MWVNCFADNKYCFGKKSLQSCLVEKNPRIILISTALTILKVHNMHVLNSQKCNFILLYLNIPLWGHVCLGCIFYNANQTFLKVICLTVVLKQTRQEMNFQLEGALIFLKGKCSSILAANLASIPSYTYLVANLEGFFASIYLKLFIICICIYCGMVSLLV